MPCAWRDLGTFRGMLWYLRNFREVLGNVGYSPFVQDGTRKKGERAMFEVVETVASSPYYRELKSGEWIEHDTLLDAVQSAREGELVWARVEEAQVPGAVVPYGIVAAYPVPGHHGTGFVVWNSWTYYHFRDRLRVRRRDEVFRHPWLMGATFRVSWDRCFTEPVSRLEFHWEWKDDNGKWIPLPATHYRVGPKYRGWFDPAVQ